MCIDFINFNHDIKQGRPKDTRKIWRNKGKVRNSNYCSLFTFLPCNCLLPVVAANFVFVFGGGSVQCVFNADQQHIDFIEFD